MRDAKSGMASSSSSSDGAVEPRPPPRKQRRLNDTDVQKVLWLHLRAPRLPILGDAVRDLDLFDECTLPHAVRNGVRFLESRRTVELTLQLKTHSPTGKSVALLDEFVLCGTTMKLALAAEATPTATFVSAGYRSQHPGLVKLDDKALFSGNVDSAGSFALAKFDAHGFCTFRFKVLLRSGHVPDMDAADQFCFTASPLDPTLQCSQLSWKSSPFLVKKQLRPLKKEA